MVDIEFRQLNNSVASFVTDAGLARELRSQFSFYASNYKWDKRYKLGYWDGTISPLNLKDRTIPVGLIPRVKRYLEEQRITYQDNTLSSEKIDLTDEQIRQFFEQHGPFTPHEPQIKALQHCLSEARNIILAPTSLGKSYIIHALNVWHTKKNRNVLILVHRANLVLQLQSNFVDEYLSEKYYSTSTIYDGKTVDSQVLITTWQSVKDLDSDWFNQFDVIIGDEIHRHKAKVITEIFNKADQVQYRHGFTATLDNDSDADAMVLEGIYGPPVQVTTLEQQIQDKISVTCDVFVVVLKYGSRHCKKLHQLIDIEKKAGKEHPDFVVESNFLENFNERTGIIANIATSLKGNTLVAYKKIEHGNQIFQAINDRTNITTYLINSKVPKSKRFDIQKNIEKLENSISVVSFGTFAEGINIPNLNNLVIGSQLKSSITVPQLIGRMIRQSFGKHKANIIEICDDLTYNGKQNIFLKHFKKRMEFYMRNRFKVKTKIIRID